MRQGFERTASFARQVDKAFMARSGIAYSFLRDEFEASRLAPKLDEAAGTRMTPAQFVDAVSQRFGLKGSEHADAVPHNRRVAALVEFASENPEWAVGPEGGIFRDGPDGIERIAPGRDAGGKRFGFAASVSPAGTLSVADGRVVELSGEFEPRTGALDIGDAVDRLEATYEVGMRM